MIKVTLYLPNGKAISAYLKKRQYKLSDGTHERDVACHATNWDMVEKNET